MNSKLKNYRPLSRKELKQFFEPYRQAFPDWTVEHDVMLTRKQGPLRQGMFLHRLGYAAYRPEHFIDLSISIPDGCGLIHQHLDVKHRQVERLAHERMWAKVLKAMEEQFVPSIRKPLDVAQTLWLAELEVERNQVDNVNHFVGLAALNAYLGNSEKALHWCDRGERSVRDWIAEYEAASINISVPDWMARKREYALALRQAIEAGTLREFFAIT
jgi:hypothetical protein